MKIRKILCSLLFVGVIGASLNANAVVLHSDAPPDTIGVISEVPFFLNADNFSLSADSSIDKISWWGGYFDPFTGGYSDGTALTDSFTVNILDDSAGAPGAVINDISASGVVTRNTYDSVNNIYGYDLVLNSALDLSAGNYYLSVMNFEFSGWDWMFSQDLSDTSWYGEADLIDPTIIHWSETYFDPFIGQDILNPGLAFAVYGTQAQVPVPPTLLLMLAPLVFLRWSRRRFNS